jgi:hypothetical protein
VETEDTWLCKWEWLGKRQRTFWGGGNVPFVDGSTHMVLHIFQNIELHILCSPCICQLYISKVNRKKLGVVVSSQGINWGSQ